MDAYNRILYDNKLYPSEVVSAAGGYMEQKNVEKMRTYVVPYNRLYVAM